MSTVTERVPLLDLPIKSKRSLGMMQCVRNAQPLALPLVSVDIQASVADRVASVTLEQVFTNKFAEALEAVYIFPLPASCIVSSFEMKVGTRTVKGMVQERQSFCQKLCFEKLNKAAYSFNRKTERNTPNEERYSRRAEKARRYS